MLRATRRILRKGGRAAFLIIEVEQGLSPRDRRRANGYGPRHVATSSTYPSMLTSAGFVDVERLDRTAAYRDTTTAWLEQRIRRADDIIALLGREEYEDKVVEGRETIAAIDEGLLRRYLYVASRSG